MCEKRTNCLESSIEGKKRIAMKVRALTFRKRIRPTDQHNHKCWLVIGRLDELEISSSVPMDLAEIKANNDLTYQKDSESCYHHIIYLIDREDGIQGKDKLDDSDLWENGQEFLSVTRIHFPTTINLDKQFNDLKEHFRASQEEGIIWRVYGTTELSDQVLVCRCQSFQQLSKWVLSVTSCVKVGKAYTYFCIPQKILEMDPDSWLTKNDCIEYLSMRFAVKNYASALKALDEIRDVLGSEYLSPPYWVSGNEDAILCGENIPVERMVGLYKTWYQNKLRVLDTFSDIISRIGTQCSPLNETSPTPNSLTDICKSLLSKFMNCSHIKGEHKRVWRRPLIEMCNALVHMSNSATLDESVYLILPGLYAFWENIDHGNLKEQDESLYLKFVESCVHTMEHLMRAEGQLSQYPEVRPITYDIPVFALESAIAFLQQLNKALTEQDTVQKRKTSILLVPSAETDVSTVELFQASEEVRGLLQINVPFSMLYEPRHLFLSLCHELAHYVGERCRMREDRYRLFSNCLAGELLFDFFPDCSGDPRPLYEFLAERLRGAVGEDYTIEKPLLEITSDMNDVVEELSGPKEFPELVRQFLSSNNPYGVRFQYPTELSIKVAVETFNLRSSDLRILFRESFADVCMLYFLKPSYQDYLEMLLKHEDNINESTCLRILLSLNAAGCELQEITEIVQKVLCQKFMNHLGAEQEINCIIQRIQAMDGLLNAKGFHPEHHLKEYITICWEELNRSYAMPDSQISETAKRAAEIYYRIIQPKETFDYHMILQDIDQSRKDILTDLTGT